MNGDRAQEGCERRTVGGVRTRRQMTDIYFMQNLGSSLFSHFSVRKRFLIEVYKMGFKLKLLSTTSTGPCSASDKR